MILDAINTNPTTVELLLNGGSSSFVSSVGSSVATIVPFRAYPIQDSAKDHVNTSDMFPVGLSGSIFCKLGKYIAIGTQSNAGTTEKTRNGR